MVQLSKLNESKKNIEILFYSQIENGAQSIILNSTDLRACGQFLNDFSRQQRGIHGTCAALSVLAKSFEQSHKDTVPKLFNYLQDRVNNETAIQGISLDPSINRDSKNIIKIGEELSCLSNVNTGLVAKDTYVQKLLTLITNSKKNRNGWGYFTDSPGLDSELLPTIFATKGILSVQGTDDDAVKYIASECVNKINSGVFDITTYAIIILGIYTLSFYDNANVANVNFNDVTSKLFSKSPVSMAENSEINIEYWHNDRHEYIRIPWQIYLVTLSAKYSPLHFSKLVIQERLTEIIEKTNSGGFKYNYSGPYVSSRTSAIIYECFTHLGLNLQNKVLYEFYHMIDKIRAILGRTALRYTIKAAVVCLFAYSLYIYYKNNTGTKNEEYKNIGADVVTFLLFWLFSIGKRKE